MCACVRECVCACVYGEIKTDKMSVPWPPPPGQAPPRPLPPPWTVAHWRVSTGKGGAWKIRTGVSVLKQTPRFKNQEPSMVESGGEDLLHPPALGFGSRRRRGQVLQAAPRAPAKLGLVSGPRRRPRPRRVQAIGRVAIGRVSGGARAARGLGGHRRGGGARFVAIAASAAAAVTTATGAGPAKAPAAATAAAAMVCGRCAARSRRLARRVRRRRLRPVQFTPVVPAFTHAAHTLHMSTTCS